MALYLVDVNLPYYFSVWRGPDFLHIRDLNDEWLDSEVWRYAKQEDLTIVTKDADFSDKIMLSDPPPRVIHIRLGNLKMRDFHQAIAGRWEQICSLSRRCKLVQVFADRLEGID